MSELTHPIEIWNIGNKEVESLTECLKKLKHLFLEQHKIIKQAEADKLEAIREVEKTKFAELTTAYDLGFKAGYNQAININQKGEQNEQQTEV